MTTLVLIDEPLNIDRRVQAMLQAHQPYIIEECIVKGEFHYKQLWTLPLLWLLCLSKAFYYWIMLYRKHHLMPKTLLAGVKTTLKSIYMAHIQSQALAKKYAKSGLSAIYAHDLHCGMVGMLVAQKINIKLIYDCHEISFHRNRKNSFLRVALTIGLEQMVVKYAAAIKLVNQPMKDLYCWLYRIPNHKITIINNNFYPMMPSSKKAVYNHKIKAAILYIGAGIHNRQLENLTQQAANKIPLYGFFLGKKPLFTQNTAWTLGEQNYQPALKELLQTKNMVMWACAEATCLSYKLSLGNKFFQAMALALPIIATEKTYLAQLVETYQIGYVYTGDNLKQIIVQIYDGAQYRQKSQAMQKLQTEIFQHQLVL